MAQIQATTTRKRRQLHALVYIDVKKQNKTSRPSVQRTKRRMSCGDRQKWGNDDASDPMFQMSQRVPRRCGSHSSGPRPVPWDGGGRWGDERWVISVRRNRIAGRVTLVDCSGWM
jgi:hypothetical protein